MFSIVRHGAPAAAALAVGVGLLIAAPASAATVPSQADPVIHVATTGVDDAACGAAAQPCATIPFAYNKAAPGDTIQVAAGTYKLDNALFIRKEGVRFLGAMAGVNAVHRTPGGAGETVVTGPVPQLSPTGLFAAEANHVTIDGFTFEGNPNGSGLSTGEGASGYVIEDNIITNNVTGLDPGSNGAIPTLITGNLFYRNNNATHSPGSQGNGIFTNRPLKNVLLEDNKFLENDHAPINIAAGGLCGRGEVGDITIRNNDFNGEFRAALTGVSDSSVTDNSMIGGGGGVNLTSCDHRVTVTGNTIKDKVNQGIRICNCNVQGDNSDITVADNIIKDVGRGAPANDGITISGGTRITVRDNQIVNSGVDGIGLIVDLGPEVPSSDVTITRNTITGSRGADSGIHVGAGTYTGSLAVHFNRIVDSHSHHGFVNDDQAAKIDARENWWGCNDMPSGAGCDRPAGTAADKIEFAPWLVLRIHSAPADILAGQEATVFSDLRHDSAGTLTTGQFFAPVTVHFTAVPGHLVPASVRTTSDLRAQTSWPSGQPRPEQICATVDNQTVCLHFPPLHEPGIKLDKASFPTRFGAAGEKITYTYTVTNTGNVTLHDVRVTDNRLGAVTCLDTELTPGKSTTCEAVYTTKQDDVEAGRIVNAAVATGRPPTGHRVTGRDTETVKAVHRPGIKVEKVAFPAEYAVPGEQIAYTYAVVNTGNVTLRHVRLHDSRLGPIACPATTLAPAESMTCHAAHTTTQVDVDAGRIANAAVATGRPPAGPPVTGRETKTVHAIHTPGIAITKSPSRATYGGAGERIIYTYRVVNTGTVTLHHITVTDSKFRGPVACQATTLTPGKSTTCRAAHTVTRADVLAGRIVNVAAAAGRTKAGDQVKGKAVAIVTLSLPTLPEVPVTG
jgi:hypothetical protein